MGSIDLRIELIAGGISDERPLFKGIWQIPGPVNAGDPLCLAYRFDENQVLDLKVSFDQQGQQRSFEASIQNPLTNVVNPQSSRLKIDELEEQLRLGDVPRQAVPDRLVEIARLYAEIGQREKAIEYLKRGLQGKGQPNTYIMNLMGIYYGEIGDFARQEKMYLEAAAASPNDSVPLFNLAHTLKRQGKMQAAYETLSKALARERDPSYLVMKAQLEESLATPAAKQETLAEAFRLYRQVVSLDPWELSWYLIGARMLGDQLKIDEAMQAQKKHAQVSNAADADGVLPRDRQLLSEIYR